MVDQAAFVVESVVLGVTALAMLIAALVCRFHLETAGRRVTPAASQYTTDGNAGAATTKPTPVIAPVIPPAPPPQNRTIRVQPSSPNTTRPPGASSSSPAPVPVVAAALMPEDAPLLLPSPGATTAPAPAPPALTITVVPAGATSSGGGAFAVPRSPMNALSPGGRVMAFGQAKGRSVAGAGTGANAGKSGAAKHSSAGTGAADKTFPYYARRIAIVMTSVMVVYSVDPHASLGVYPQVLPWLLIELADALAFVCFSLWLLFNGRVVWNSMRRPVPRPFLHTLRVLPFAFLLPSWAAELWGVAVDRAAGSCLFNFVFAATAYGYIGMFVWTYFSLRRELRAFLRHASSSMDLSHVHHALRSVLIFMGVMTTAGTLCASAIAVNAATCVGDWHDAPIDPPPDSIPVFSVLATAMGWIIAGVIQWLSWPPAAPKPQAPSEVAVGAASTAASKPAAAARTTGGGGVRSTVPPIAPAAAASPTAAAAATTAAAAARLPASAATTPSVAGDIGPR